MQTATPLPHTGYLRLADIVGSTRLGKPAIIPISRSTFLAGVKSGRYPLKPIKLSERCTAYRVEEVKALLDQLSGAVI